MKIIHNIGTDRVIDLLRPLLTTTHECDLVTSALSLFAFSELVPELSTLRRCRLVLPPTDMDIAILGSEADRAARNRLQTRWLARQLVQWLEQKTEVRRARGAVPLDVHPKSSCEFVKASLRCECPHVFLQT